MVNGLVITGEFSLGTDPDTDPGWAGMSAGGWPEAGTHWARAYRHWSAAISEGLCPRHGTPLEPWPAPPRRIAGRCADCHRYWGANLDDEQAGWWLDHNPVTGWPAVRVPEFMAWREEG